jgi:hypothetical protein
MAGREGKSRLVNAIKKLFIINEHHLDSIGLSLYQGRYVTPKQIELLKTRVHNYRPY